MNYTCRCGTFITSTSTDWVLPCPKCGKYPTASVGELTPEDVEYLADFIFQTLQENDESDPFDEDEANYLLELRRKLKMIKPSKGKR